MKRGANTVGVFGASGDLGGQMVNQLLTARFKVLCYDVKPSLVRAKTGIDPAINRESLKAKPHIVPTLGDLVSSCGVIHWCAPANTLSELDAMAPESMVVLHDGTMSHSFNAIKGYRSRPRSASHGEFAIAHCLMNPQTRVFVADHEGNDDRATSHFKDIGLDPEVIAIKKHDKLMAITQGKMAIGVLADLPVLREQEALGNLTTSGQHYLEALTIREERWTPATLESILSNPELIPAWQAQITMLRQNNNQ